MPKLDFETGKDLDKRPFVPPYLRFKCEVCGAERDQACRKSGPTTKISCICRGNAYVMSSERSESPALDWWTLPSGELMMPELSRKYATPIVVEPDRGPSIWTRLRRLLPIRQLR